MQLPSITNKQQEILLLLYRFRFLHRIHIQTLLKHNSHNRINAWLKDLTVKHYTGKTIGKNSKINTTPTIYYLSKNAIRFLKTYPACEKTYITKLYREHKRSDYFINRCLFIADIYLYLSEKFKTTSDFTFYTQSDYSRDGIIKEIFPLFVFRKKKDKPYYVAEMFREKQPRFAIRARITSYIDFFTRGEWAKDEKTPKILFICPDEKMENYVASHTQGVLEDDDIHNLNVYTTTMEKIREKDILEDVWRRVIS